MKMFESQDLKSLNRIFEEVFGNHTNPAPKTTPKQSTNSYVESLQETIEDLQLEIMDQDDAMGVLKDINASVERRSEELQQDRDAAVARCTALESDKRRLELELERKEEIIRNASYVSNSLHARMETEKGTSAHLARQAIRLNEENEKLKLQLKETQTILDNAAKKGMGVTDSLHKEIKVLLQLIRSYNDAVTRIEGLPWFSFVGKAKEIARKYLAYTKKELDDNNIHLVL